MTDQVTRVVPAGWYQDPAVTDQVRWWNGLSWTEHVREKPQSPAVAREAVTTETSRSELAETTAERIRAARDLERQFGIGTSENEIITSATALGYGIGTSSGADGSGSAETAAAGTHSSDRGMSATPETRTRRAAVKTTRTQTGASWLIALTPLLTFLVALAAAYCYYFLSASTLIFAAAAVLPYLLGVLWAYADGRALTARGLTAPSPAWALLSALVYLVVRRVQLKGSGPLIMFLVLGTLAVVLPLAALASGQLHSVTSALTIQNAISKDYVDSGQATSVRCPTMMDSTVPGTLYTCTANLPNGTTKQIWVSIDGRQGQFSYAMGL